jgi:Tfp pilus assembly protein PilO
MKKLFALVAGLVLVQAMGFAQTSKDPQQELIQAQQKIRSLQASDQQIKAQVATLKKDQAKLEADIQKSVTAGDSLMKATMDSIRISNERSVNNEKETASVRSSLSLQQNLVIVALVMVVCLFLLFLWQRRMIRTLASVHEADITKMTGKMELQAGEISAKVGRLQDQLSQASLKSEEKIGSLKALLSKELAGLTDSLNQTAGQIREDHRAGMAAEQKSRGEEISALTLRLAALDEKLDTGLDAAISHLKHETENHRKEVAEIRKTLTEVSKSQKGRGSSAE